MKRFIFLFVLFTVSAHANPFMTVKERLRLHLWVEGMEERPVKKVKQAERPQLPEELERALRKI